MVIRSAFFPARREPISSSMHSAFAPSMVAMRMTFQAGICVASWFLNLCTSDENFISLNMKLQLFAWSVASATSPPNSANCCAGGTMPRTRQRLLLQSTSAAPDCATCRTSSIVA